MGCCCGLCMLIFHCTFQLVTALVWQVFDFLGYQWAPVLATFVHVVMVLLGLSGAIQYWPPYLVVYAAWAYVGSRLGHNTWNIFITCFYLEVGGLSKTPLLVVGAWPWLSAEKPVAGLGPPGGQALEPGIGCALEHGYVEALHSALQILVALVGFVYACYVVSVPTEEEDSSSTLSPPMAPNHPGSDMLSWESPAEKGKATDFIGGLDPFPLYLNVTGKRSSLLFKPAHLPA